MEFSKFDMFIKLDYGTMPKNPDEVKENDFLYYRKILYINFNNRWYIIRNGSKDIEYIYNFINNSKDKNDLVKNVERVIYDIIY